VEDLMPWCETCSRFLNPNTLESDGTCPSCGRKVAEPAEVAATRERTPWHFKLLLLAVVVYLGWRLVQLVEWLIGRF
jgi:hypothetical protein